MKKKTLIVTAISIILGLSACSEQKTAEQSFSDAQQLLASNQIETAIIELKNAIVQSQRDPKLRALLGEAYINQGFYVAAEKELEMAASLGYQKEVAAKLSFVKMKLKDNEAVYELLINNPNLQDKDYVLLLIYAGRAAMQENKIELAQDYLSQAISLNEDAVYKQIAKAYFEQAKNNYSEALNIIEKIVEDNPSINEALLLKGHLLYGIGEYARAAKIFELYLRKVPKEVYVVYFKIDSLIREGQYDLAEKDINWLLGKLKNAPLAYLYKAQISFAKKDYSSAKQTAEKTLSYDNRNQTAKLIAALSAFKLEDYEQAYSHLSAINGINNPKSPAFNVYNIVKSKLGYEVDILDIAKDASLDDLLTIATTLNDSESVLDKSKFITQLNDIKERETTSQADKLKIDLTESILTGKVNEGLLKSALAFEPDNIKLQLSIISFYLQNNEMNTAFEHVKTFLVKAKTLEERLTWLNVKGFILQKMKEDELAIESYVESINLSENNINAYLQLTGIYLRDGNLKEASKYNEIALNIEPNNVKAIVGNYILINKRDGVEAAIEYIANKQAELVNEFKLFQLYATALISTKQWQKLDKLFETSNYGNPKPELYWTLWINSILDRHENEKLIPVLEAWTKDNPKSINAWRQYLFFLEASSNYSVARNAALIAFKHTQLINFKVAEIGFLIKTKNFVEAEKAINELPATQKAIYQDEFLARIYDAQKKPTQALNVAKAWHKKRSSKDSYRVLANAYFLTGNHEEAINTLENMIQFDLADISDKLFLARVAMQSNPTKSIDIWKDLADSDTQNYVLLNNIAWAYYQLKDYSAGITYAKKALELTDNDANVLHTYALLIKNKDRTKAIELLQKAANIAPSDEVIKRDLEQLTN